MKIGLASCGFGNYFVVGLVILKGLEELICLLGFVYWNIWFLSVGYLFGNIFCSVKWLPRKEARLMPVHRLAKECLIPNSSLMPMLMLATNGLSTKVVIQDRGLECNTEQYRHDP